MNQSAASLVGMEMIYELCTKAATFITDRHLDSARGKQASFQDQRRKREEEEAKVCINSVSRERLVAEQGVSIGCARNEEESETAARSGRSGRSSALVPTHLGGCSQERRAEGGEGTSRTRTGLRGE